MLQRLSFVHLVVAVLVLGFIAGIVAFVLGGATTNKGTTGAIAAERANILAAEKASCDRYGSYGSIATLRREHVLTFQPVYNSVVYLPGTGCGSIVVGSAAYQSAAG